MTACLVRHMFPNLSVYDVPNRHMADTIKVSKASMCFFSGGVLSANFLHLFIGELCFFPVRAATSVLARVSRILEGGNIRKISQTIVCAVKIYMIDLLTIWAFPHKSKHNKPVNHKIVSVLLAAFIQPYLQVPPRTSVRREDNARHYSCFASSCFCFTNNTPYSSKIANFITTVIWDWFPYFVHGSNYTPVGSNKQDPNTPQWSAISEIHAPGARPDNVRESGCFG
jgi:hypothetical protein